MESEDHKSITIDVFVKDNAKVVDMLVKIECFMHFKMAL